MSNHGRPIIGSNCEYQSEFARRYPYPIETERHRRIPPGAVVLVGAILFAFAAMAAVIFVR